MVVLSTRAAALAVTFAFASSTAAATSEPQCQRDGTCPAAAAEAAGESLLQLTNAGMKKQPAALLEEETEQKAGAEGQEEDFEYDELEGEEDQEDDEEEEEDQEDQEEEHVEEEPEEPEEDKPEDMVEPEKVAIPAACSEFFVKDCGMTGIHEGTLKSKDDIEMDFGTCCSFGGHDSETCTSLSAEIFDEHEGPPTESLCTELVDLFETHKAWVKDAMASRAGAALSETDAAASLDRSVTKKGGPSHDGPIRRRRRRRTRRRRITVVVGGYDYYDARRRRRRTSGYDYSSGRRRIGGYDYSSGRRRSSGGYDYSSGRRRSIGGYDYSSGRRRSMGGYDYSGSSGGSFYYDYNAPPASLLEAGANVTQEESQNAMQTVDVF